VFFSITELQVRKANFDVSLPVGHISFDDKVRQVSNLDAEGTAELLGNTLGEVRVRGRLTVSMEADCDRCLELLKFPLDSEFDLFYRPAPNLKGHHSGEEVAIDEGESQIAFYEGAGLELDDILREHILLTLPMQYVCSESCKGICPLCGSNRNQAVCGCSQRLVDDRWAALKILMSKEN
jgi:uncharacterized protein